MKIKSRALWLISFFNATPTLAVEVYNKDGGKVDIYGQLRGLHYFSDEPGLSGDKSYFRGGISTKTTVNEQLTGYAKWEFQVQGNGTEQNKDDNSNSWTRLAFVGIKSEGYGSFDYGRNYGVLFDVRSLTEVMPEFVSETFFKADNFMSYRATGLATYRNENFFGLSDKVKFALQYQGANENPGDGEGTINGSDRNIRNSNGDGWGTSINYNIYNGIYAVAAYTSSDRTNEQVNVGGEDNRIASGERANAWAVGMMYDLNKIYIAANYAETSNMTSYGKYSGNVGDSDQNGGVADETKNVEFVAQYLFDFGVRPSFAFIASKGGSVWNAYTRGYEDKYLVKYLEFGTDYYFNKNLRAYVDYKLNLLDSEDEFYKTSGINTDDVIATGFVYQF